MTCYYIIISCFTLLCIYAKKEVYNHYFPYIPQLTSFSLLDID